METTTTVVKRATLQEVGASTEEGGGKRGHGGGRGDGVMQVGGNDSAVPRKTKEIRLFMYS